MTSNLLKSSTAKEEKTTTIPHVNLDAVIIEEKSEHASNLAPTFQAPSQEAMQTSGTQQEPSQIFELSQRVESWSSKNADEPASNVEKKDFFNDMVIEERPDVVKSITYKLKSHFVNHSIYITLGYIEMPDGRKRPLEIFINSKDLTKTAEFALLGRLLSAIFRRTPNPVFILEELNSLFDPNGGYLSNGRFYASIYAEIAEIIERFFRDIRLLSDSSSKFSSLIHPLEKNGKSVQSTSKRMTTPNVEEGQSIKKADILHSAEIKGDKRDLEDMKSTIPLHGDKKRSEPSSMNLYRICPACDFKTLKFDNGCYICLTCGYSKCE